MSIAYHQGRMKYRPKTKPFPHQARATLEAARARNYGIFMEPRLGKSKAALDYCGILAMKGEVRKVLILAPRIALNVWQSELQKHFPFPAFIETFDEYWATDKYTGANVQTLEGVVFPTPQFFLAGREETFVARKIVAGNKFIIPYRQSHADKGLDFRYYRPKQDELEEWNPDVVILDESHQYKRPGGRGAQDAWRLIRRLRVSNDTSSSSGLHTPYVLLLSGTPNPKGWRDLFAQFRIMDETIFGTNAGAFDRRHVVYGHGKRKYTILQYRGEKTILKKVRRHSISVSAEEAGLQGVREWNPIKVKLPAKAMTAYMQMAKEFVTEVEDGIITAKNAGVMRLRLLQITGGFTTEGKKIHGSKVDAVRDWCLLLQEQEQPYIVGARFTPEVHAVAETVSKFSRIEIVEGATRKTRDLAIKDFQRGRLDALVFQVQSGSAAIELARASEMVYYSLPDGWVDFKQFGDRILGPHQKNPVRYTPILASGTLDRSVVRALMRKEDYHATLMKSPERFLAGLI